MKTIKIVCILIVISCFYTSYSASIDNDTIFPTPPILKGNVAFWIKIYTEVSMSEGFLHDRDYPLVIFEKIPADGSSQTLKNHRKKIVDALTAITSAPPAQWNDFERQLFDLYKKEADSTVISGAADRIRFQQGQMERFKEGLRRSGQYLDTMRSILRSYGVPPRLAFLPHVESSFNTEAYSKVGAAGLWQFMRGTGKLYGMRIDYTIDERRDPVIATTAAAKYLSSSFGELGNWPLAITSYNHGVYGMKRAVAQTGSRDLGTIIQRYKSRSFQFASSNFYSCFLAASYVAENHALYFPDITLCTPVQYTDLTITHYVAAEDFCLFMGILPELLMHLNPAIRPAVFSNHQQLPKGFTLHIPGSTTSSDLVARYQTIPDSLKKAAPPRPQYYRVNKGDNLYAIALRLGVSVTELTFENNITKINRIRAGQILRVPAKPAAIPTTAATVVAEVKTADSTRRTVAAKDQLPFEKVPTSDAALEIAQAEAVASIPPEEIALAEPVTEKPVAHDQVPGTTPPPQSKKTNTSTIGNTTTMQPGVMNDSLKEIAFAPAIIDSVKSSTVRPRIATAFDVAIYNLDAVLSPVGTAAKITVSIDETIGHYADWLDIPTWRIRKLNDMGRSSAITVNHTINIPIDRPDALEQFAAARLEYHMAIEEDFYSQYTVSEVTSYKLKRGETLWDICNNSENPLPLWLLRKYNQHIDLSTLYARSEVWIPQVRELTAEEIHSSQDTSLPPPPPALRMRPQESQIAP